MGKTHRKSRHFAGKTRQRYVEDKVQRDYAGFMRRGEETVRLVGAERRQLYEARMDAYHAQMRDYQKNICAYEARLAALNKKGDRPLSYVSCYQACRHNLSEPERPYVPHIQKWKRVAFEGQTFSEYFAENAKDYERAYDAEHRDGGSKRSRHYETARGTMPQKERRADDRRLLRIIKKDVEAWENSVFMTGKEQFWDYWW